MNVLLIALATFGISVLTVLSGFGLGTLLTPLLLTILDIRIAVGFVAIVHAMHSLFKLRLFYHHLDWHVLKRFGLIVLVASATGAFLQALLQLQFLKMLLGIVLVLMGLKELHPYLKGLVFPKHLQWLGAAASGLLGGLVGNQGALRSAYLLEYNLSKEAYVACSAALALVVDLARIPLYLTFFPELTDYWLWLLACTLAVFAGTLAGKRLLQKLSTETVRRFIALTLILFGATLFLEVSFFPKN